MLRLRLHASLAAIALCLAAPVHAQGLGGQLDAAEQKLTQDSQSCTPINLGEYQKLLNEAAKNKRRAEKAKNAGAPVDQTQIDADLAKASDLFNRALAAHIQQCGRQATGQGQTVVQPQTTSAQPPPAPNDPSQGDADDILDEIGTDTDRTPTGLPPTPVKPPPTPVAAPAPVGSVGSAGGSAPETTGSRIEEAKKKLDADIKAGRPVNAADYEALLDEAQRNLKAAEQADKVGLPIDHSKVFGELEGAADLVRRAHAAEARQAPPTPEPEPTPKTGAMNLTPFANGVLALHNATRAQYGAPALKWDPGLALRAGAWAGELAGIGRLEHSPREGRGTARENLAQAPLNWSTPQIIGRWVGENVDFVPGTFPNICRSGGMCDGVLHLSQMIWPTTTALGCGSAIGQGFQYVVCYYDPGGNKDGKLVGIPLQIADIENSSSRLPLIGGGKAAVTQSQGPNAYDEYKTSKGQAALFDLGIYAGGAWTTDWFEIDPPSENIGAQINLNHDYGYDAALFVGYDLGAFRLESEVAYKKAAQAIDWEPIEDLLFRGSWAEGFGEQGLPDVYTTVEQPALPKVAASVTSDDVYWGSSAGMIANLSSDTRLELGTGYEDYDSVGAPFPGGIYWDPISQVTDGAGATYVDYDLEDLFFGGPWDEFLGELIQPGADTKVEQPELPKKEVFKPDPPKTLEDPM